MKKIIILIIILLLFISIFNIEITSNEDHMNILQNNFNLKEYKGIWKIKSINKRNKILKNFHNLEGDFILFTQYLKHEKNRRNLQLRLNFLDGKYKENWLGIFLSYLSPSDYTKNYNINNNNWTQYILDYPEDNKKTIRIKNRFENEIVFKIFKIFQIFKTYYISLNILELNFTLDEYKQTYNNNYNNLKGKLYSFDGELEIEFNGKLNKSYTNFHKENKNFFLFFLSLIGFFHIIILFKTIRESFKIYKNYFDNFDHLFIANDIIWNALICLGSTQEGLNQFSGANRFVIIGLLYFFIFAFIEGVLYFFTFNIEKKTDLKLLILITLYSIIYLLMLINYLFIQQIYLLIFIFTTFLPQIFYNLKLKDKINKIPKKFIFSLLLNRLFLPIYIRGYSNNIFLSKTNYKFCFLLISSNLIQLVILFMQEKLGGNFFIPKRFKGHYFRYKRNILEIYKKYPEFIYYQCSICLAPFVNEPENFKIKYNSFFNRVKIIYCENQQYIMKTPCQHFFHMECLKNWMVLKKECPICRKHLPKEL